MPVGRRPEVFVRTLSMVEGQRLQGITRTAKEPCQLKWITHHANQCTWQMPPSGGSCHDPPDGAPDRSCCRGTRTVSADDGRLVPPRPTTGVHPARSAPGMRAGQAGPARLTERRERVADPGRSVSCRTRMPSLEDG